MKYYIITELRMVVELEAMERFLLREHAKTGEKWPLRVLLEMRNRCKVITAPQGTFEVIE